MSLLLNMLSRLVITFLPRSKHLLISWLQLPSAVILEPKKNKVWLCCHCFPIYFPWSDGTRCHDLRFLNVYVLGECNCLASVLSQQKLEATDVKALGVSQLSYSPCYSSRTDQSYLENKGKYILEVCGHADPKDTKRRERERERKRETTCMHMRGIESPDPLSPLFICFFLPLGLPYVVGQARSAVCFTWDPHFCLRPSFVLFSWAFSFLFF